MLIGFRFGLGIITTHLTYICHKCLFHMDNHINVVTNNANSVFVIFYVAKKIRAYICQMCGKFAKTNFS